MFLRNPGTCITHTAHTPRRPLTEQTSTHVLQLYTTTFSTLKDGNGMPHRNAGTYVQRNTVRLSQKTASLQVPESHYLPQSYSVVLTNSCERGVCSDISGEDNYEI
jgi:hypothetical protein